MTDKIKQSAAIELLRGALERIADHDSADHSQWRIAREALCLTAEIEAPTSAVAEPEAQYQLLIEGDVISIGDETLNSDCTTWDSDFYASDRAMGKHFIGCKYGNYLFVPHRRKIETQSAPSQAKSAQATTGKEAK